MPGASRLLAEPMYRTRSGASPWSAPIAVAAELGVVVVLDDQTSPRSAQAISAARRSAFSTTPRRELMRGRDDHRVGAAALELVDVEPVGVDPDRGDLEPRLLDDQAVGVPARILERDPLDPVLAQPPADQREPLAEAGADDDVLGVGRRAADAREVAGERTRAARGRRAGRGSRRRRSAPGATRAAQRAQPAVAREAGQVGQPGPKS